PPRRRPRARPARAPSAPRRRTIPWPSTPTLGPSWTSWRPGPISRAPGPVAALTPSPAPPWPARTLPVWRLTSSASAPRRRTRSSCAATSPRRPSTASSAGSRAAPSTSWPTTASSGTAPPRPRTERFLAGSLRRGSPFAPSL
ncbi:hypothetical protein CTA2_193, partial [Colletotrichum tanaceti]